LADFDFKIEGFDELIENLDQTHEGIGPMVREFFSKAGHAVEAKAKQFSPVDTGRLRSSITNRVGPGWTPEFTEIGPSDLPYARAQEYGLPKGHFPPPKALDAWAKKHGLPNGYVVARAIAKHGMMGRAYMSKGYEDSLGDIDEFSEKLLTEIVAELAK
jgi:hypothetical protein